MLHHHISVFNTGGEKHIYRINTFICTTVKPSTTNILIIIIRYNFQQNFPFFPQFFCIATQVSQMSNFGEQNMLLSDYPGKNKNNTSDGTNRQMSSKVAKANGRTGKVADQTGRSPTHLHWSCYSTLKHSYIHRQMFRITSL